jgi:hypothetical protein
MTHEDKVKAFLAEMTERGESLSNAAPSAFRQLWRLGVNIAPPYFLGWTTAALLSGVSFAMLWGVTMAGLLYITRGAVPSRMFGISVLGGVLFGVLMASIWGRCRRRLNLSQWEDYPSAQPAIAADGAARRR